MQLVMPVMYGIAALHLMTPTIYTKKKNNNVQFSKDFNVTIWHLIVMKMIKAYSADNIFLYSDTLI